jgi:hypothetical protein
MDSPTRLIIYVETRDTRRNPPSKINRPGRPGPAAHTCPQPLRVGLTTNNIRTRPDRNNHPRPGQHNINNPPSNAPTCLSPLAMVKKGPLLNTHTASVR